ncbi:MAG: GNAT family N-acetyltransferase [Candidatus Vogelbacteria bacterium]|nr:GNAT family N-acetyltransferase [Candidatus Vogelbacteria bacterium]
MTIHLPNVNTETNGRVHFAPFWPDENPELIPSLVVCYQKCFADEPWNEWVKCPHCHDHWGKRHEKMLKETNFHCPVCLVELIPFWPAEQIEAEIRSEISPEASCWLAKHDDQVIGFCWGYPITPRHLEQKLNLPLTAAIAEHFSHQSRVAYQDEVGVHHDWRQHKIATAMVRRRLTDFLTQGLQIGVVRTREKPRPSVTFSWYTRKLGYKIIARYPDNDGRVVLGRYLHGLDALL